MSGRLYPQDLKGVRRVVFFGTYCVRLNGDPRKSRYVADTGKLAAYCRKHRIIVGGKFLPKS